MASGTTKVDLETLKRQLFPGEYLVLITILVEGCDSISGVEHDEVVSLFLNGKIPYTLTNFNEIIISIGSLGQLERAVYNYYVYTSGSIVSKRYEEEK